MGHGNHHVLSVSIGSQPCPIIAFRLDDSVCGRHPYVAKDERRLLDVIRSKKLQFDSDKFESLSPQGNLTRSERDHAQAKSFLGLDFLQGMLVYDTVHRRTLGELIVHPWLTVRAASRVIDCID